MRRKLLGTMRFYEIPRVNIISTTAYILQTLFYLLRQFISVRFSKRIAGNITQIRNSDKFCRRSIPRTRVLFFLCLPVSALFSSLSSASSSQWSVLDTRKMLIPRSSLRRAQNKLKQKNGRDKKTVEKSGVQSGLKIEIIKLLDDGVWFRCWCKLQGRAS